MKTIKTFLEKTQRVFVCFGFGLTVFNIVFFPSTNSLALLAVMIYWIILGMFYQIKEKLFFIMAIICLILSVPPLLLENLKWAERFSVWEFLFIILALWQWLYSELKDRFSKK